MIWVVIVAGLLLGCAAELLIGASGFGWPGDPFIAWQLRLPRLLAALGAGSGLAACGLLLQVLLRNPLASPYTMGVGSGAALGAAVVVTLIPSAAISGGVAASALTALLLLMAWVSATLDRRAALAMIILSLPALTLIGSFESVGGVGFGAFFGALAVTAAILTLVRRAQLGGEALILMGIAVALCASAGVLLLHYLADRATSAAMIRWTMGGLATVGLSGGLLALAPSLIGTAWLLPMIPQLNLLSQGDDWAAGRGVDANALKRAILFAVALWTGAIVALAGPISFIGLIGPHIGRAAVGADLRRAAPAALLIGAGLLALCDALARLLMAPAEIPVGVLTALLGGPFFLLLLLWRARA